MHLDFAQTRYQLITRHALALAGVLAAEIHLRDTQKGPLRPIACSIVPPTLALSVSNAHSPPSPDNNRPQGLLDTEGLRPFFRAVLSHPGLRETELMPVSNGRFAERSDERVGGPPAAYVVAGRIEARGKIRGLAAFVLDHQARPAERVLFEDFIAQARRVTQAGPNSLSDDSIDRLEAVLQLAETALVGDDLEDTLQAAVVMLRQVLDADLAAIILLDETRGTLHPAGVSLSDRMSPMMHERVRSTWQADVGITGWVSRNLRPILVPDVRDDPRARERSRAESVIAAPLTANGKLIGVLRVGSVGANRFGESDLRLIEVLARQTAVIVENARMQDRLRQQNESLALLARLVEASRDSIMLIDPKGSIQHCNPAMEALFGYTKGAAVGKRIRSLMSDRYSSELRDEILTTLRSVGDWQGEIEFVRADGSQFPAELHASVVLDELGARIGWVSIVHDLTRRKLWEQELVQTEKLRSLGVMAAGVAHEVNNTLAMVLGQAELLSHVTTDPTARRNLDAIILAAEDGAGAVRRITEFSRPSSGSEFSSVDLAQVVHDVLRATAPRWRDQASREGRVIDARAMAAMPVWVTGSVTELREAVTNLVLNAVDALPNGGSIAIETQQRDGRAVLTVSDTGTGMSEEVRERVFDPFFTTKPFGVGTGLGLALTYGIVERHQGTVQVSSQPGRGTTFEIELALAEPPVPSERKDAGQTTPALRILVVEDEEVLGEQLRTILTLDGHTIKLCSSGREALDALDEPYDLVITDLGMPGIGGKEVASSAKARFPDMRVGLVTGWTSDTLDLDDLAEGSIDFVVSKPYRIQTIREAVAKACGPAVASVTS